MLKGESAVITGAASGIGRAVALEFARSGAELLVLDRDGPGAERTAAECRALGAAAAAQTADVLRGEELAAAADRAETLYGKLDIWCSCAGVSTMGRVWELTEREWDFNMDVNAKGVFLCLQAAARKMMPRRYGRILAIASIASLQSDPLLAHYCASKWAVLGLSKTAAVELGPYGITVNCVCPGTARTSMQTREIGWSAQLQGISPEEVVRRWVEGTPVGRLTEAEDVARAVEFLARRSSAMITGAAVPVTGGAEL